MWFTKFEVKENYQILPRKRKEFLTVVMLALFPVSLDSKLNDANFLNREQSKHGRNWLYPNTLALKFVHGFQETDFNERLQS